MLIIIRINLLNYNTYKYTANYYTIININIMLTIILIPICPVWLCLASGLSLGRSRFLSSSVSSVSPSLSIYIHIIYIYILYIYIVYTIYIYTVCTHYIVYIYIHTIHCIYIYIYTYMYMYSIHVSY